MENLEERIGNLAIGTASSREEMMRKFGTKKKKAVKDHSAASEGPDHSEHRDRIYASLLGRIFGMLRMYNPDLVGDRKRYTIVPPNVQRDGKRTVFSNVGEIATKMNRPRDHLIQFLCSELGTVGSIDGSSRLIIKGKFQQKQVESVLRRYVLDYVTCKTCKSPNTKLVKNNRLFSQRCESCRATRTVSAIKTGFKTQAEKRATKSKE